MPQITIITPTYNSSKFIKRTIQSVIGQTCTDWEYLIIDDHSTDNTVDLVNEFTKQDPRIKLYKKAQNSGGPALPKNIGIENAKGEYVAFLDHDDEWLPQKLEKQISIFNKTDNGKVGLVSCFASIRDINGKLIFRHNKKHIGNVTRFLANNNFIATSSCVITKLEIFKKIGYFDTDFKMCDDWDMWLRISESGYEFDFVQEYLTNYIKHENNAYLKNTKRNDAKEFILIYKKHISTFTSYSLKASGLYNYYEKNYKQSRKYYTLDTISKYSDFEQKIKSIVFIILTYFPNLENYFRNIFYKIKKFVN